MAAANTSTTQAGARGLTLLLHFLIWPPPKLVQPNNARGPPRPRCEIAAPQSANPRIKQPAIRQAVIQQLNVINEVTEETDEEKEADDGDIIEIGDETNE